MQNLDTLWVNVVNNVNKIVKIETKAKPTAHNNNEVVKKQTSFIHSDVITHEEEKLSLVLVLSIGFTVWYMFK